jgi:hypothetical protein
VVDRNNSVDIAHKHALSVVCFDSYKYKVKTVAKICVNFFSPDCFLLWTVFDLDVVGMKERVGIRPYASQNLSGSLALH